MASRNHHPRQINQWFSWFMVQTIRYPKESNQTGLPTWPLLTNCFAFFIIFIFIRYKRGDYTNKLISIYTLNHVSKQTFLLRMISLKMRTTILDECILNDRIEYGPNSQDKHFPEKKTVDTNPRLSLSHLNATGCRLWFTGSERSQSRVVKSM